MKYLLGIVSVLCFAAIAASQQPQGRLINREVYDLNGKRLVIEESTDDAPQSAKMAKKTAGRCSVCADCDCGASCACDAKAKQRKAKESPAAEYPTVQYTFHKGYWWQSRNGQPWEYCTDRAQPGPAFASDIIQNAPFVYTSPVYYTAPTYSYPVRGYRPSGAYAAGVSAGACTSG